MRWRMTDNAICKATNFVQDEHSKPFAILHWSCSGTICLVTVQQLLLHIDGGGCDIFLTDNDWLVVWNIFYIGKFGNVIIPIDGLIFFREVAQPPTR